MINGIVLFASSRRNGNTGKLVDRIAEDLRIEVVDLSMTRMSAYDYEHRNRDDDFEPLVKRVLEFDQVIFASPVYWYAVSPPMKIFLDRISDFLELPELIDDGRRLRGKDGFVVCTSIYEEVPKSVIGAFIDTFDYLGLRYGGLAHVNCREGYVPAKHDMEALAFSSLVRNHATGIART